MTEYIIKRRARDFNQMLSFFKQHEKGSDIVVIFNKQRISLHSVVLGGNSRYFEINLFSTPIVPKTITLENVNNESIKPIIEYCYLEKMKLEQESAIDTLEVAHFLMVQPVIDGCWKFLISMLDSENCLKIKKIAQILHLNSLEKSAIDYFQIAFNGEINDSLRTMNLTQLIKILQSNVFNCAKEKCFMLIKEWIYYDPEIRKENLMDLLKYVQLEQFHLKILASQSKNLCFDKNCFDFFVKAFNKQPNMDILPLQSILVVLSGENDDQCKIIETYDTRSNNWRQQEVEFGRKDFSCVFYDQKIFVLGGNSKEVECYDIKTWGKTSLAPMHRSKYYAALVVVGEYIYAIGGSGLRSSAERYNIKANQWTPIPSMPTDRIFHKTVVVDDEIFVIGGYGKDGYLRRRKNLSVNECFTISTGNWRSCKPLQEIRKAPAVTALYGFIYAAGGGNDFDWLSSVEIYDPKVDKWTFIEPLSSPRIGAILVNVGDSLIISGGVSPSPLEPIDTVEKYDPLTKQWSRMASLNKARNLHNMVVVHNIC